MITQALLDFVRQASEAGVLGYTYKTFEDYPRDWFARLSTGALNCPAVFVTWGGFQPVAETKSGTQVESTYEVTLVAKNLRNIAASRDGARDGAEVGSQQLLADMVGLLTGQSFLEAGPLRLGGAELAALPDELVKLGLSIAVVQFKCRHDMPKASPFFSPNAEFTGDLKAIDVMWLRPKDQDPSPDADPTVDLESTIDLFPEGDA